MDPQAIDVSIQDLRIISLNTGEGTNYLLSSTSAKLRWRTPQVAVTALLVYEILITSGQEIRYVWR